jgi:NitT/TauT family transport system substrate-binding protein
MLSLFACKKSEKVRIGLNAWPGYEFLYLSNVKGFDKALGTESEIIAFGSLADGRRSFERGEIDILATTVVEALLIKKNTRLNPKIFHVIDYSSGGDVILTQSKYKSLKELKGKTIGVEIGSVCI